MGELVELVEKEPVEVLDVPDVELAWPVEPPVDECVAVCVDELCPWVDVGALEVLLDGPEVEVAWLEEAAIIDVAVDKIVVE